MKEGNADKKEILNRKNYRNEKVSGKKLHYSDVAKIPARNIVWSLLNESLGTPSKNNG